MTALIRDGQVHVWDDTHKTWKPADLGLGNTFFPHGYDDLTVTVPAPTSAPTLTKAAAFGAGLAAASYKVAYTYLTWNGETGLSPATTFTGTTTQGLGVKVFASLGNNSKWAVACNVYMSNDGGATYHKADGIPSPNIPGQFAFGDNDGPFGGSGVIWNAAGAAPPAGAATTTTFNGLTVSPPVTAPTVTSTGIIAATTYYGAYAYLCGDGTESALSAISSGIAVSAGDYIKFRQAVEPPSGAVAVRRYLGTTASAGSMHLQDTVPLSHVNGFIFAYNSGGAAPSAGTAHSVVSGFQQAYDASMEAGGGIVSVVGTVDTQVPLILRLKNSSGTVVTGVRISGAAADMINFTSVVRIQYTGTQTGVIGILACGSAITWENLDFADPNSRVKYALVSCDFFGGGGFQSVWKRSSFSANAAGSIGFQIPIDGASTSSHITSELYFENCQFGGLAWGADVHGNQTGDLLFRDCGFFTSGDSSSANSGNLRWAGDFNNGFEGITSLAGAGEYRVFFTLDARHPLSGNGFRQANLRQLISDATASALVPFIIYSGPNIGGYTELTIEHCVLQAGNADIFALYSYNAIQLTLIGNNGPSALGWINFTATSSYASYANPQITVVGRDRLLSDTNVKIGSSLHVDYSKYGMQIYTSAYALSNETNQTSLVKTNSSGDIVLDPYSGNVKVPDDAYDSTTWNGNTSVPTKNAIRDKLETIIPNTSGSSALPSTFTPSTNDTFEATGLTLSLTAGTYLVLVQIHYQVQVSAGYAFLRSRLYNNTDSAAVSGSELLILFTDSHNEFDGQVSGSCLITVAGTKTIELQGWRSSLGTYSSDSFYSNADGRTTLTYVRLT